MGKIEKEIGYKFIAEEKDGIKVLYLSGKVSKADYWTGKDVIDAKSIRDEIENTNLPIRIYLNSPGGDVLEGIEIYNFLKNHKSDITVEITGLCASAATFIALGADKVVMDTGTQFMIHQASSFAYGNKEDIRKVLDALESIDESIISIYQAKTGKEKSEIEAMLKKESWMTCEKALENGFIDEIKEDKPMEKEEIEDIKDIDIENLTNLIANELEKRKALESKAEPREKELSNFTRFMKGL